MDIVATRTALRFQNNVGSSLDQLRQELRDTEPLTVVAKALGRGEERVDQLRNRLAALVQEFGAQAPSSAEDLVEKYRTLRQVASNHRAACNELASDTKRRFSIEDFDGLAAQVFVPKSVTTTHAVTGAVLVRFEDDKDLNTVECEIDGVLLEFPQSRSFSISQGGPAPFAVRSFDIIGKRGGMGTLNVDVRAPGRNTAQPRPFKVAVAMSPFETARDVFVLATPCGGVVGLFIWFLWKDATIAGPLGAGTGGAIALLLFFLQRLRSRA